VVLAGWVSLWVFWAFGVMDREELVATMMMMVYELAFCGLFPYMIVFNELTFGESTSRLGVYLRHRFRSAYNVGSISGLICTFQPPALQSG
jgi:hypothetical protein